MAYGRFDVPVRLVLASDKGYASLISMGSVRAEDIEGECRSRVDALAIGLEGYASFGGDAEINALVIEASAEFCESAVAFILDVISSQRNGRG